MLTSQEAIQKALEQFESGVDDTSDEILEFLLETSYLAREKYVKLYAARLLSNAPQQTQPTDMPFKTMGEFNEQTPFSEL